MGSVPEQVSVVLMDRDAKQKIRDLFDRLEQELAIDGIGVVLSTSIFELVENAVKANLKRVFFAAHGYSMDERESYEQGLAAFVKEYGRIHSEQYETALRALNLIVKVEVDRNHERLLIFVENNAILLAVEEKRIRSQLAAAMATEGLDSFYLAYGDESEGSGMGLAMIVFLIRNLGFNPGYFRVYHKDNKTTARLEFPMHADYVPIRERFQKESPG